MSVSEPETRFELRIDKIVAGGEGLGRHEGQVVFVPQSAPGDRLLVEVVETRRDYRRARIVETLHASLDRREPPCPFYSRCGGCSLMHLSLSAQVEAKREILMESLRRVGKIDYDGHLVTHTGPESGYRARARFHIRFTKRGGPPAVVGFRERGSHRLVDITRCHQISPQANTVLENVRSWLSEEPARARGLVSVEILEPVGSAAGETTWPEAGRLLLHFVVRKGGSPSRAAFEELAGRARLRGLVVTEEGKTWDGLYRLGQSKAVHRVGDIRYQTRVGSFFQTNHYLLETLVEEVTSPLPGEGGSVVDLYCGVGLFTLPMTARATRVVGVESSPPAIGDARANARKSGIDRVEFVESDAADYAVAVGFEGIHTVIVDPPRGGLHPSVVEALVQHPPRELRYVSCDPAGLGRDAGRLASGGLVLERLVLLDFFPNTHHFEVVATFRPR